MPIDNVRDIAFSPRAARVAASVQIVIAIIGLTQYSLNASHGNVDITRFNF